MTREEAEKAARELIAQLDGEGWEVGIWHNLKWCYCARNGYLSVHQSVNGKFHAYLSETRLFGGSPSYWYHKGSYDTPMEAVNAQIEKARLFTNRCMDIVYEVSGIFADL